MKAFYVFLLTVGLCLADEKVVSGPEHLSNTPKSPTIPSHASVDHNKEKSEVPVPHDDIMKNSSSKGSNTTTTQPPTPQPTTTTTGPPAPVYGEGKWNVTDDKGIMCIIIKGKIELNLVNETDSKVIQPFKVPSNAPSHGSCEGEWIEFDLLNNSNVRLTFDKNATASKFYLRAVVANLSYVVNNKTITDVFKSNDTLHLFENSLNQSYFCSPSKDYVVAQKPLLQLKLIVDSFQVQAFKNSTTETFDTAVNCEASGTPDIVPIIVGCALAVLVILVLVAYLISRRRSQSRGYTSM